MYTVINGATESSPGDWYRNCKCDERYQTTGLSLAPVNDPEVQGKRVMDILHNYISVKAAGRIYFSVSGLKLARAFLPAQGWVSYAEVSYEFSNGEVYVIVSAVGCDEPFLTDHFARDCCRGEPFLQNTEECHAIPAKPIGDCIYNLSDPSVLSANQVISSSVRDRLIASKLGANMNTSTTTDKHAIAQFLERLCTGFDTQVSDVIMELEQRNPLSRRSQDEVVAQIRDEILAWCPYTFECERAEFGGVPLWVILLIPWIGFVWKLLKIVLPMCYSKLPQHPDMAEWLATQSSVKNYVRKQKGPTEIGLGTEIGKAQEAEDAERKRCMTSKSLPWGRNPPALSDSADKTGEPQMLPWASKPPALSNSADKTGDFFAPPPTLNQPELVYDC
jgi:hypothetical protein